MKEEITNMRDVLKDFAINVLLAMADPDPATETNKRFLSSIIPDNWIEKVYELDNRYLIEATIDYLVSHDLEAEIWQVIKDEFGENIISIMAENSAHSTSIKVQLKKPNYEEKLSYGAA